MKNKFLSTYFLLLIILLFVVTILIFLSNAKTKLPSFEKNDITTKEDKAFFKAKTIPQPSFLLAAHSSTVTSIGHNELLAFWFAGSHEGQTDVKIWQSHYSNGQWSNAVAIVSPKSLTLDTQMFIKKVGNPVVYLASNGVLHLFVVSVSFGGWAGCSINHLISTNKGKTWQKAQKMFLTPFLNISTLARTNAITLTDGGFYLPVYYDSMTSYPELLRFDKDGNFIEQIRISNNNHFIQPTIAVIDKLNAYAFLRNNTPNNSVLYMQKTSDAGRNWSRLIPTNLTNQDSSLVVLKLNNCFLMVHNIKDRNNLNIATSRNGIKWSEVFVLEHDKYGAEFSYPSIVKTNDQIDILYTWQRKLIKHVSFNLAWLRSKTQC